MKKLYLIIVILIAVTATQAQTTAMFDIAPRTNISIHNWADFSSTCESMTIGTLPVEFVAKQARVSRSVNVTNHIVRSSHVSPEGKIIKGVLHNDKGNIIGTARFSIVGTSMAGTADIGNDSYKFRPDKDGNYYWELEAPFVCGTEDVDHNGLPSPTHQHTEECHHNDDHSIASPSGMRDPQSCVTESIQDVAFVTDDLMDEYGDDLDAILAQIAISDSWAEDIMTDSGFPDIAFFQESVHVVDFAESGTTWGNLQVFDDSLYVTPPGNIANIAQSATSWVMTLYGVGGGSYSGVAVLATSPLPQGQYYELTLGNNGGLANYVKMHEYGHALWGGRHEDQTPNPVLYRRAYLGYDATLGENYVTVMGQGNFGGGSRVYRFSESDPTAGWYDESIGYTFSPVGTTDHDMCRRITEEWNRSGIVQTVDITPATPTISADGATTFCDGGSVELSVDTPESGVDYIWTNGETGNNIVVTDAGTYSCYGEASPSCTGASSNEIIVTVNALPNTPSISVDDSSLCEGETATLTVDSPETGVTYYWSDGQTGNSIPVTVADDYDCYGDNGDCQGSTSNSITITVTPLPSTPNISADGATTFCEGGSVELSVDTPESGVDYIWTNGETGNNIVVTTTGTYSCYGENGECTSGNSNSISVTEWDAPVANAGANQSISYGTSATLDGSATGGDGNYTYSWTPIDMVVDPTDPHTETVILESPQNFTVEVTDGNGCMSEPDDVFIDVTGGALGLNPDADPDVTCGNTEVQLSANPYGGTENYTYSWTSDPAGFNSVEENPVDTPSQTTTYICEVNDGNTTATEEKTVTVYDPIIVDAGPDMGLELGQSTQFDGSYSGGSGDITILWEGVGNSIPIADPSILNPIVGPFTDIDVYYFTLTVIDNITGCESTDEMFVDVILGIEDPLDADDINVYPNPTTGNIFIDTQGKLEMISIVNMTGSEIFYSEDCQETCFAGRQVTQIDLSRVPSGLYFVRITMNGITYVKKVEKQ